MDLPFSVIVRWDRFYYISLSFFLLGLILMPFSRTASVIFFLLLITFWTAIPGLINIYLIEVDVYEMVFTIMALKFGGILAGLIAIPYIFIHSIVSIQFKPLEAVRYAIAAVTTLSIMPLIYSFWGQNLLLTMYSYTVIAYTIYLLVTIFLMPAEIFETIRYMLIAIPIAFITNTAYVNLFGDPMLALFDVNLELKLGLPFALGAFLLAITSVKIYAWYSKKQEKKKAGAPRTGAPKKPAPATSQGVQHMPKPHTPTSHEVQSAPEPKPAASQVVQSAPKPQPVQSMDRTPRRGEGHEFFPNTPPSKKREKD